VDLNQLEQAVAQWGRDRNIIGGGTPDRQMFKLMSELGETADAWLAGNITEFKDGIGDCTVVLIILAQQTGTTLTECLSQAYNDIKDRKGVLYMGTFIKETDPNYPAACAKIWKTEPARDPRCVCRAVPKLLPRPSCPIHGVTT
jgi:NTP pyrophosphatase (non-canonical NTP hydrolase)